MVPVLPSGVIWRGDAIMLFSRFKYALLAGSVLATGAAQAACNLELSASLPLKVENDRMFIPGHIGEHPVQYLVDLASMNTLLTAAGRDYGVTPDNFRSLPLKAIMGDMEKQATLGPDADHNVALAVDRLPMRLTGSLANFGSPQAVAVLGMDFCAHYDVEFDTAHQTLNLFKTTGCESAKLAYWTKRYVVADMVANITRPLNVEPYTVYNFPHINLRVSVNGHDMLAAIDTGYRNSGLSLAAAHTAGIETGPETDPVPDVFDGYSTRAWLSNADQIALGSEVIASAKPHVQSFRPPAGSTTAPIGTIAANTRNFGDDMMLGADFFLSHRVLVSYSQNKVYFSPVDGQTFLGGTPVLPAETAAAR
jgi:hypothetical protein